MKTKKSVAKTAYPNTLAVRFRTVCAARLLPLVLLLALPAVVQAQFYFTTNNGTITITGYSGPPWAVTIPTNINGLPVTSIGNYAFYNYYNLTSVTIPNSVTSVGDYAFEYCSSLFSVAIGNSVTSIGDMAFSYCTSLTAIIVNAHNPAYSSVAGVLFDKTQTMLIQYPGGQASSYTVPNSVTSIGDYAFSDCLILTSVIIPRSITSIGNYVFYWCRNLTSVYFKGNAPSLGSNAFYNDNNVTVYYLPGTTGWGTPGMPFGGCPTALWSLPYPLILNNGPSFGMRTNQFGFIISWATNISVVVEACSLANLTWVPLQTNTLTGGWCYFSDPAWTNYPVRCYRLRSP